MSSLYLDAGPMIRALLDSPDDFERCHNCVRHRPSRHWLTFDRNGNARIFARCSCAELPISREQSIELRSALARWEEAYWRPLVVREAAARRVAEINREFARHFGPKTGWRRVVEALSALLGFGVVAPGLHIDPSLPEDQELLVAALDRGSIDQNHNGCTEADMVDAQVK